MQQEYNFYPAGNLFQRLDPEVNFQTRYDVDGRLLGEFLEFNQVVEFKNGIKKFTEVICR